MSVSSAKPLPGNDQITNYIIILINMVWSLVTPSLLPQISVCLKDKSNGMTLLMNTCSYGHIYVVTGLWSASE